MSKCFCLEAGNWYKASITDFASLTKKYSVLILFPKALTLCSVFWAGFFGVGFFLGKKKIHHTGWGSCVPSIVSVLLVDIQFLLPTSQEFIWSRQYVNKTTSDFAVPHQSWQYEPLKVTLLHFLNLFWVWKKNSNPANSQFYSSPKYECISDAIQQSLFFYSTQAVVTNVLGYDFSYCWIDLSLFAILIQYLKKNAWWSYPRNYLIPLWCFHWGVKVFCASFFVLLIWVTVVGCFYCINK